MRPQQWCKYIHIGTFIIENPKRSIISYSSFLLSFFLPLLIYRTSKLIRMHARTSLDQSACIMCVFFFLSTSCVSAVFATWLSHLTYIYHNRLVCACVYVYIILVTNKFVVPLYFWLFNCFFSRNSIVLLLLFAAIVYTVIINIMITICVTDNTLSSAIAFQNAFRFFKKKNCHLIRTLMCAHACPCVLVWMCVLCQYQVILFTYSKFCRVYSLKWRFIDTNKHTYWFIPVNR